jgi:hypothetical protein
VPAIARLVAADEDTVRDVIHAFNVKGLAALDPNGVVGRSLLGTTRADQPSVKTAGPVFGRHREPVAGPRGYDPCCETRVPLPAPGDTRGWFRDLGGSRRYEWSWPEPPAGTTP